MSSWLFIAIPLASVLLPNGVAVAFLVRAARRASNAGTTTGIVTERSLGEQPPEDELEALWRLQALWRLPAHRKPAL
jgi:hypothetical protein